MNYYEHHLGDYAKDAGHLSMIEHGAFRLLLDAYYIREAPLPVDIKDCCKLARAISKPERDAVAYVLREFFEQHADGWRQPRADREIERYQDKQAKAKRSAEARWNPTKTQSEGNANACGHAMRTHSEGNANGVHRAPVPSPQSPVNSLNPLSANADMSGKPSALPDVTPIPSSETPKNGQHYNPLAREVLGFLNAKTGRHYQPVDANLKLIVARLKEGASVADCRAVVAKKCREWSADEKMGSYLRPATLFNATKFAQYRGELLEVGTDDQMP